MYKNLFAFLGVIACLSCTSDNVESTPAEVSLDHFTIEERTVHADGLPDYILFTTGTIVDNKMHSHITEVAENGVSQGQTTTQHYFYTNNRLTSTSFSDDIKTFYYNTEGDLTGITWQFHDSFAYYRILEQTQNEVFFEKVNAPYDDPSAVVERRFIATFDDQDNVIAAGRDLNLDGVCEQSNTFVYQKDNLVSATFVSGNTANFSYSDIVDTQAVLNDNTYGKRVLRLLCSEVYGSATNVLSEQNLSHSRKLTAEAASASTYVTGVNGFYTSKSTQTNDDALQFKTTKTFYFN